jgi:hypothetical protein
MTPYIGPIMQVVTIMASMTSSSRHSTYPPKAPRMDLTTLLLAPPLPLLLSSMDSSSSSSSSSSEPLSSSVEEAGDGAGAGWSRAHPPLLDMGGRHISLYTESRRSPVLPIRSSTLLVDLFFFWSAGMDDDGIGWRKNYVDNTMHNGRTGGEGA